MDLTDCYKQGFIRKARLDKELIKSLIEMSNIKDNAVTTANITENNISAYVSLTYDSLREALEALCLSREYKVTNHQCIGELLKEMLTDFDYSEFDRYRYIRNGINYYGTKIEFKQGKEIIQKILVIKNRIIQKYLKEYT
ncbi:MAG: hypothetical protein V2A62_00705 [Candidatus Woesearchaeota archaeon]